MFHLFHRQFNNCIYHLKLLYANCKVPIKSKFRSPVSNGTHLGRGCNKSARLARYLYL